MMPLPLAHETSLTQALFNTTQPSSPWKLLGSPLHQAGMVLGTCLPLTSVNEFAAEVFRYSPTQRSAPAVCSATAGAGGVGGGGGAGTDARVFKHIALALRALPALS
jgi:hypothetical protein